MSCDEKGIQYEWESNNNIIKNGYKSRSRPKNRWMDCVKNDMSKKGVNTEMTADRRL